MEEKLDLIISLLNEVLNKPTTKYELWTFEQENFLLEKLEEGFSFAEIIPLFKKEFGIERTQGALISRHKKLKP